MYQVHHLLLEMTSFAMSFPGVGSTFQPEKSDALLVSVQPAAEGCHKYHVKNMLIECVWFSSADSPSSQQLLHSLIVLAVLIVK